MGCQNDPLYTRQSVLRIHSKLSELLCLQAEWHLHKADTKNQFLEARYKILPRAVQSIVERPWGNSFLNFNIYLFIFYKDLYLFKVYTFRDLLLQHFLDPAWFPPYGRQSNLILLTDDI